MLRKDKEVVVKKVSDIFKSNDAFIFFQYKGFTSNSINNLRLALKKGSSNIKMVKNSLAYVAAKTSLKKSSEDLETFFHGSALGIAYGDISFCAKELKKFTKENANIITITGGLVEGKTFGVDKFDYFASMPSREEMIDKIHNLIISPVLALQRVISAPMVALNKINSTISK